LINASLHTILAKAEWVKPDRNARIVYSERHPNLGSARKRELQLKKWSRAKKEALIAGDLAALKKFSRCKSALGSRWVNQSFASNWLGSCVQWVKFP
jgi:hypothetical protein